MTIENVENVVIENVVDVVEEEEKPKTVRKKTLPEKYAKLVRFGFFLMKSFNASNNGAIDEEAFLAHIHLFDDVEEQTAFFDTYVESIDKGVKGDIKLVVKNKNNGVKAKRQYRKKVIPLATDDDVATDDERVAPPPPPVVDEKKKRDGTRKKPVVVETVCQEPEPVTEPVVTKQQRRVSKKEKGEQLVVDEPEPVVEPVVEPEPVTEPIVTKQQRRVSKKEKGEQPVVVELAVTDPLVVEPETKEKKAKEPKEKKVKEPKEKKAKEAKEKKSKAVKHSEIVNECVLLAKEPAAIDPELEEDNLETEEQGVEEITINGVIYYINPNTNVLFDITTEEEIGIWNHETETIEN